MNRAQFYSPLVLINCRGFHETNAMADGCLKLTKKFWCFFVWLFEKKCFCFGPSLFFSSSIHLVLIEWDPTSNNQNLSVQQEHLSGSASPSALSVHCDQIKILRLEGEHHSFTQSMQMHYRVVSAIAFFQTCHSPLGFQATSKLTAHTFSLAQTTTKTFNLFIYHITPSARWILFLL